MNATFILLGGTGDLATQKLYPSLYKLYVKDKLDDFDIIGTSRHEYTIDEYRDEVKHDIDHASKWDDFAEHIHFQQLDFYQDNGYEELKTTLQNCADNKIFYLATIPQHFDTITDHLERHNLATDAKVVYEKPFGDDLASAQALNACIRDVFPEDRVYRVDHYLDKELVENINIVRFTNTVLNNVWNATDVNHIQVVMSEDFGVDNRREFYDQYGAVKDVLQNHLLQLLALTAMDEPTRFNAEHVRDEKVHVLQHLTIDDITTGQYQGYTNVDDIPDDSTTETLVAAKTTINTDPLTDVPAYLMSGKALEQTRAYVHVEFNNCDLFDEYTTEANALTISIKPDENIYLTINTKEPERDETTTSTMEFCYSCQHGPNTPEAYENVFTEVLNGRQRFFVRNDEIEAQWQLIDDLDTPEPFTYQRDTLPRQVRDFIQTDGHTWYKL